MSRVAILGTGLIGSSIGLRLKASGKIPDLEIAGYDRKRDHARAAERLGAVDTTYNDPRQAVEGASLVILSVPVLAIGDLMEEVSDAIEDGAVVTDTGSTKAEVLRWARDAIPSRASFVGGHPMAGKTESGPDAADADLFEGAQWVVVPSVTASKSAVTAVAGLAETCGATVIYMDAEEHDAYVAAISHLPLLAATALFRLTRDSEAWPEMSVLAAGGFSDTTRLASTHPDMAHDIAITNRTQLVHWIERYREALLELEERIADVENEEELFTYLARTSLDRDIFENGHRGRVEVDQKGNEMSDVSMTDMMLGDVLAQKMRDITKRSEDRISERERDERMRRNR